ncbi:hypothetical protein [Micromonospora purpureochromogenes]|uniref:Zinc transporter ZupT n=1 Tax=Micromonospora purpureochromogenes TaxID=47872 RepID=A0ABX2RQT7_9ACTN|nr:hypothetical protein [Micromonospora purpureochromogenes]NYF58591.1 zinc transporter ZupT [Micromonospora purpureochromogenes]
MDATDAAEAATPAEEVPLVPGVGVGFVLGLFGHLVAVVAFGYVGIFTGGADAGDQLASGLAAAYLVAVVASAAVLLAARRARRQQRRKMAAGLLSGMVVGILLLVLLSARIFGLMSEVAATCPCDPIIDQVRFARD